jgi:hypothetical protein
MRLGSGPGEWDRVDETRCRSTTVELWALRLRQLCIPAFVASSWFFFWECRVGPGRPFVTDPSSVIDRRNEFIYKIVWGAAYNIKVSINTGLAHDHCSTWVLGFKSSCSCFCMPPFLHCDRVSSKTQSVRDDASVCLSATTIHTWRIFQARCDSFRDFVSVI